MGVMVSRTAMDRYLGLNGKYLVQAEDFLRKKDYSEASEKFWGACAGIVKAVAAKRGKHLKTHADLFEYVRDLSRAKPELALSTDFLAASHLHSNFYEDELPDWAVEELAASARMFVQKMRKLL